jgi:hypothetical protein
MRRRQSPRCVRETSDTCKASRIAIRYLPPVRTLSFQGWARSDIRWTFLSGSAGLVSRALSSRSPRLTARPERTRVRLLRQGRPQAISWPDRDLFLNPVLNCRSELPASVNLPRAGAATATPDSLDVPHPPRASFAPFHTRYRVRRLGDDDRLFGA